MPEPIKRHTALQPLSREHHFGLLLSWKIRQGMKRDVEGERIKKYIRWFWESELRSHFRYEEEYVFPILGSDDELVQRAEKEHEKIEEMISSEEASRAHLDQLQETLIKHIRFEERILFNKIESVASEKELQILEDHDRDDPRPDGYEDEFWV
ncbi:MAG: hemerythrin domain-containing protein [Saprospiraceae bacterium]|nr:hemerythrin domain-containing protein [Saprospiraceae bacterium]